MARVDDQHGRTQAHEDAPDREPRVHAAPESHGSRTRSARKQRDINNRVAPLGECDFVSEIAATLPLQIICDMMGIPRRQGLASSSSRNKILGVGDPEYVMSLEESDGAAWS